MDEADVGATVRGYTPGTRVFQRFVLRRVLGRGGMGVVWLALDEKLDREVALKFLPEVMKSDRPAMEELKRETKRALELTHSNIVRIYDFLEDELTAGISMEFVPGDTLSNRRLAQPHKVFDPADLRHWTRQLCEALAYAHEKAQVVHRDLKPANLLLDAHGDIKITDFGIARSISDSISRISVQASSSGTPAYMSPQQMMGENASPSDDVYSLGATLYELLCGRPPFSSGNIPLQVQTKVPARLNARRVELGLPLPPVPNDWEETIALCLEKDPALRPASAHEVAQRLGVAATTVSTAPFVTAGSSAPRDSRRGTPPAPSSAPDRRRLRRALLATGLVAAAIVIGYLLYPDEAPTAPSTVADGPPPTAIAATVTASPAITPPKTEPATEPGLSPAEDPAVVAQRELAEFSRRLREGAVDAAELARVAGEDSPRGRLAREQIEARRAARLLEEQWRDALLTRIAAFAADADRGHFDAMVRTVESYLAAAPAADAAAVAAAWAPRRTAWEEHEQANRPGAISLFTDPPGATVTLLSRGQTLASPALFADLPPGEHRLRIERAGHEPREITCHVLAGETLRPATLRLVPHVGNVMVTSDPSGVRFTLEGPGRSVEGVTPRRFDRLPQGRYRAVFQRDGWPARTLFVEVERDGEARLEANLRGATLDFRSEPTGARVVINGQEYGRTPLRLTDWKPGDYRLDLLLDGYENHAERFEAGTDLVREIKFIEKPLTAAFRQLLVGRRWVTTGGRNIELEVDAQGRVTGAQQGFGGRQAFSGRIESYDARTRTFVAQLGGEGSFTGRQQFQFTGDDTFRVSTINALGLPSEIVFRPAAPGGSRR